MPFQIVVVAAASGKYLSLPFEYACGSLHPAVRKHALSCQIDAALTQTGNHQSRYSFPLQADKYFSVSTDSITRHHGHQVTRSEKSYQLEGGRCL